MCFFCLPAKVLTLSNSAELSNLAKHNLAKQFKVTYWAGPWLDSRAWWQEDFIRAARMQIVTNSNAYLLALSKGEWFVEAVYE